jgi:2-keto-4-pentenoate hydratase/2-oxohepta-3-ene-1,7-dioic acid hydratase in catechol pathway
MLISSVSLVAQARGSQHQRREESWVAGTLTNNFGALVQKMGQRIPAEPLYLLKAPNTYLDPGAVIPKPSFDSRVVFEGELAVVIGRTCKDASETQAMHCVFGYTCANDATAEDLLTRDRRSRTGCAPRASTDRALSAR